MSARDLGVSVGSHNLNSMDADQEDIAVKAVNLHEQYDSWTITNDICLLELQQAATFGEHVGAIALPAQGEEYESGTSCTVTGWGATSEGGNLAGVLQKVGYRCCRSGRIRASKSDPDPNNSRTDPEHC